MKINGFMFSSADTNICEYRDRSKTLASFYIEDDGMAYSENIHGLFNELNEQYDATEWRLFIDSSKSALKAVLLHIGNDKPSVPIVYAPSAKESYDTLKKLLDLIKYCDHN